MVELGAGPGLPGLFAAACGAVVTITDLERVVPLIQQNILANSVAVGNESLTRSASSTHRGITQGGVHTHVNSSGRCAAEALQWGSDDGLQRARLLGAQGIDYVVACDTCYIDPVRRPLLSHAVTIMWRFLVL